MVHISPAPIALRHRVLYFFALSGLIIQVVVSDLLIFNLMNWG